MSSIKRHGLISCIFVAMAFTMALLMFIPASVASANTINPDSYVSDGSKVLSDNTKIMVAGMNVKYSGYGDRVTLVFVTRPGQLNEDISSYKTGLFNYLGVGSKNDNKGVMILLMPDARKYAVEIGDGITGNLRSVLSTDYIGDSPAINLLKSGNWDAAAKTMIALTDDRISSVETDSVVIKTTTAPMTASESRANEKMYKQKAMADAASAKKMQVMIIVGLLFAVVLTLVIVMFLLTNNKRKRDNLALRNDKINQSLSVEGFFNNDGINATNRESIMNRISSNVSDVNSTANISAVAHEIYERDVLPDVLANIGSHRRSEYADYISTLPNQDKKKWWSSYGIDSCTVLKDADEYFDRKDQENVAFEKAYAEFKKAHSDVFTNPNFDEDSFRSDLRRRGSWTDDVFQPGSNAWMWMWVLYNGNGGEHHYAQEPTHYDGSSSFGSSSSSSYDSSSFSGGFDGGFSSGGGGFSGGF